MKTTQLFRLISIINSLFIIPACSAQNPSQSLIEDIFEDLSVNNSVDNAVNEPNWENELEELSVRLHEPVDLNRATRQQLEQFPFLSDIQIEHLLAYIYVHGQMKTLYELQLIEDMDRQTIQYLLPFVCIKAINNESSFRWKTMLKSAMKYGKNEVITRIDIPFYKRKGYEHTYLGPSVYNSVKYAFRYRDQLYAGFVAEKDAGEPFFALHMTARMTGRHRAASTEAIPVHTFLLVPAAMPALAIRAAVAGSMVLPPFSLLPSPVSCAPCSFQHLPSEHPHQILPPDIRCGW